MRTLSRKNTAKMFIREMNIHFLINLGLNYTRLAFHSYLKQTR